MDFEEEVDPSGYTKKATCSDLQEGKYVMLKNRPCKIVKKTTADAGKHGPGKVHLKGIDIFKGDEYEDWFQPSIKIDVPIVTKVEYELADSSDGFLSLIVQDGSLLENVKHPDGDLGKEISTYVERQYDETYSDHEKTGYVTVLKSCGEQKAIGFRTKS
ncbi:eukaryotic translation initiation factor 5A-1-like isoform X1 [Branchiostoma floridae x Branchiostoma belcheri]